jgi:hypothetical protein
MATLTIRNVPPEIVERVKEAAARNRRSMEEEVRRLLENRYPPRDELLRQIREKWKNLPLVPAGQIEAWIEEGREGAEPGSRVANGRGGGGGRAKRPSHRTPAGRRTEAADRLRRR